MRETWYVLEDGSCGDPREVALDDKGALRHKDGRAVAIGDHGNPRSSGVDLDADGKLLTTAKPAPVEKKVEPVKEPATQKPPAPKAKAPKPRKAKAVKQMSAGGDGLEYKTR
jgi:hypothetical protein